MNLDRSLQDGFSNPDSPGVGKASSLDRQHHIRTNDSDYIISSFACSAPALFSAFNMVIRSLGDISR